MAPAQFENAFSEPRIHRFWKAKGIPNWDGAILLYQTNLRLSVQLFAVMSIFEVVFRNAINRHYGKQFGEDWLKTQAGRGGFLDKRGCEKSRGDLWNVVEKLGKTTASNNQIVAEMSFSFWRYLFNSKEFAAGGSSLLQIFASRPAGLPQKEIFNDLAYINFARNRVAHHEPICFEHSGSFRPSPVYVQEILARILKLCSWLDLSPAIFLGNVDSLEDEIKRFEILLKS